MYATITPLELIHESSGSLLFASELKSLLASGHVPMELDQDHVDLFFHLQYVPEPRSILRDARKLPAGHLLTFDTDPWRIREHRYWGLTDSQPLTGDPGETLAAELRQLAPAISRSDAGLGVALSGGVDSSLIAALVAERAGLSAGTGRRQIPQEPLARPHCEMACCGHRTSSGHGVAYRPHRLTSPITS